MDVMFGKSAKNRRTHTAVNSAPPRSHHLHICIFDPKKKRGARERERERKGSLDGDGEEEVVLQEAKEGPLEMGVFELCFPMEASRLPAIFHR
ncbi:hypothetical protein L1049_010359 [Liquidambar formosana]|uniref:Uncharacterized protein n=1 Tax=Liquidambar formosana TaxID=63359 RepID=A0AAP0N972_LIQFO